jgi:hypothetical protein
VYPKEVSLYLRLGRRNKLEEQLLSLMIVQNPHSKDPKVLFRELKNEVRRFSEVDNSTLDREGLQRLKKAMINDSGKLRKK